MAQKMCDAGLRLVLPRSYPRDLCSGYFFFKAFFFLLGHEIAHIARGHVDYWEAEAGSPFAAELTGGEMSLSTLEIERQTIEMDADMRLIFANAAPFELTSLGMPPVFEHPWAFRLTLESGDTDLGIGLSRCTLLFRLFGDIQFRTSELATDTYPPLPVRLAIV